MFQERRKFLEDELFMSHEQAGTQRNKTGVVLMVAQEEWTESETAFKKG